MRWLVAVSVLTFSCVGKEQLEPVSSQEIYYPAEGEAWEKRDPEALGMDSTLLEEAIAFAQSHETTMPQDPGRYLRDRFAGLEHQEIVGPTKERGGVNGLVIRNGYIVAEWGDTQRVDMTFSVTKSYLSTLAGIAVDRGMIPSLDDPIGDYVKTGHFDSPHNQQITWKMLLQQTSEWEGTLWEKPDTADRRRGVDREIQSPGTFWEYNDVRVNLLAFCLLQIWRGPLPQVLKEEVMNPIGSSDTWEWHGYQTSYTELDGEKVQSVSGGGHWGGGMFISSRDHARFGLLFLRGGKWGERRIASEGWIKQATTPTAIQDNYGFMWWLNTDREQFPSAPESSFFALGAGSTSTIAVIPDHELVIVSRWVDGPAVDGVIERVLKALK